MVDIENSVIREYTSAMLLQRYLRVLYKQTPKYNGTSLISLQTSREILTPP